MSKSFDCVVNNKNRIFIGICYAILILPMLFSMYYSIPASDDFAMALGRENAGGWLSELWRYAVFFYTKRGGTIIAFVVEYLINPLNLHIHLGHAYGVYMIVAFLLCTWGTIYAVSVLIEYVLPEASRERVNTITLIILAVMYSTYYYVESFNWFVGVIAYEVPMTLTLLTFEYIIKYQISSKKKYFVLMIIAGFIAANNLVFDVPLGLFFLYVVYFKPGFDKNAVKENVKKGIPLYVFIVSGLISFLSPGNFVRKTQYVDGESASAVRLALQTVIDLAERTFRIIVDHPFTVLLFIILIYIGILSNAEKRAKATNPVLVLILGYIAAAGALFPYVYARGFTTIHLAVRMQYVMDYFIELTMCITCILLGRCIATRHAIKITETGKVFVSAALIMFAYVSVINNYAYLDIVQVDILKSKNVITTSYDLWDGILKEIEESEDEDVVVERDYNIKWSPYFFYAGIDDSVMYDDEPEYVYSPDHIMPNVYYHKDSILLKIPETPND